MSIATHYCIYDFSNDNGISIVLFRVLQIHYKTLISIIILILQIGMGWEG